MPFEPENTGPMIHYLNKKYDEARRADNKEGGGKANLRPRSLQLHRRSLPEIEQDRCSSATIFYSAKALKKQNPDLCSWSGRRLICCITDSLLICERRTNQMTPIILDKFQFNFWNYLIFSIKILIYNEYLIGLSNHHVIKCNYILLCINVNLALQFEK